MADARIIQMISDHRYQHLIYEIRDRDLSECVKGLKYQELSYVFFERNEVFWTVHIAWDYMPAVMYRKKVPHRYSDVSKETAYQGRKKTTG